MIKLRSSGIDCWHGCPKKYDIKYNQGYQSVDTSPILTFGLGIHEALECRGKGGVVKDQRLSWLRATESLPWYKRATGEALVMLYNAAYADEGITYKEVEYAFEIELSCAPYRWQLEDGTWETRTSFVFKGKFDGLCIDSQGRWFIMEHKTTRADITEGSKYWLRRDMNTQADSYLWAARKIGFPVEYMLYDVIKVPQLRPRKATPKAKQEFYKRDGKYGKKGDPKPTTYLRDEGSKDYGKRLNEYILENAEGLLKRVKLERTEKELDNAERNLQDISSLVSTGIFPSNPNSCYAYNEECEYKPVCMGETNLQNTGLYQLNGDPLGY